MTINFHAWRAIGANETILEWLASGIKFDFITEPPQFKLPNKQFTNSETLFLREEIQRLLDKKFIKQCYSDEYVTPLSCVHKKTGGHRLIINLRYLNTHCVKCYHKIEDIKSVASIIQSNDYFTSIDLKDSFYHFKIHEQYQKYLTFLFENKLYSFCVLPFGFSLSPYFHAKILRPVVGYLRSQGVRLNLYVDDFLIASHRSLITDFTDLLIHTLEDLGLRINYKKSVTTPSQLINYLGYTIDSRSQFPILTVSKERITRLKKQIRLVLKKQTIPVRVLAKTAGLCISTAFAVSPGKLFLRDTYRLISSRTSWDDTVLIDDRCTKELIWWLESVDSFNYKEIKPQVIEFQIEVDASSKGWGAVCCGHEAKGDWNSRLSQKSSNHRELFAILMALETFRNFVRGSTVEILSDNSTAGAYIRNKGGPVTELTQIAIAIWGLAEHFHIDLICTHIPGVMNSQADRLSRSPDVHNWMIHPTLFNLLNKRFGPFSIDRFATNMNAHLPRFNSRYWEPESEGINALAQDWSNDNNFANPPWALIPQVIAKVIADRAECTVITPVFPAQAWFWSLWGLAVCEPILLPTHGHSMMYLGPDPEPLRNKRWRLAAWKISGKNA